MTSLYLRSIATALPSNFFLAKILVRVSSIAFGQATSRQQPSANYTALRAAISAPLARSVSEIEKRDEQVRQLLGKSVSAPKVISLAYANGVSFSHTGRILGIDDTVPSNVLDALAGNLTDNFGSKMIRRGGPLVERELVFIFLRDLRVAKEQATGDDHKKQIQIEEEKFTNFWLSASVNSQATKARFEQAALALDGVSIELAAKARSLADQAGQAKPLESYAGTTLFLRQFDTKLALSLLQSPSAAMTKAAKIVAKFLAAEVNQSVAYYVSIADDKSGTVSKDELTQNVELRKFRALANKIDDEARPWFSQVSEIGEFIANPNRQTFESMLGVRDNNGYDIMKLSYLGVKISGIFGNSLWKKSADTNYCNSIVPTRSMRTGPNIALKRADMGTNLPFHPILEGTLMNHRKLYKNITEAADTRIQDLTEREKNVLINNGYNVFGASGSTNIMSYFYQHIHKSEPAFNVSDAFAGTMMFLTLDGGHAISEAVMVNRSLTLIDDSDPDKDKKRTDFLNKNILDYTELENMFSSADTKDLMRQAVTQAFNVAQAQFEKIDSPLYV